MMQSKAALSLEAARLDVPTNPVYSTTPPETTYRRPPLLVVDDSAQTCAEPDCYVRTTLHCEYHRQTAWCARHWTAHKMACRGGAL